MSGQRVAVLGATGWVGRHVCAAYARRGREVVAVARRGAAHTGAYRTRELDVAAVAPRDLADLLAAEDVGVVVNATDAANARDGWQRGVRDLEAVNVTAVTGLLDALARMPWRPRLVHLGTLHEYGPLTRGKAVREDADPRPADAYARTRLAGTRAVLAAACAGEVEATVLRLANVCGPHPSPRSFPGVLLRTFGEAARGAPASLRVADARRDFVDVGDAAEAVVRAAAGPRARGRALNIGGGRAVAIADMVGWMAEAAGLPRGAVTERPAEVPGLGGDWSLADIGAAARLLNWRPRTTVKYSLERMWRAAGAAPAADRAAAGGAK